MAETKHRVGILGGTFDPIHNGHLMMAEAVRDEYEMEKVLFIPAAQPPHKRGHKISPAKDRYMMTVLATCMNPAFEVSDIEMRREGPSYSIATSSGRSTPGSGSRSCWPSVRLSRRPGPAAVPTWNGRGTCWATWACGRFICSIRRSWRSRRRIYASASPAGLRSGTSFPVRWSSIFTKKVCIADGLRGNETGAFPPRSRRTSGAIRSRRRRTVI